MAAATQGAGPLNWVSIQLSGVSCFHHCFQRGIILHGRARLKDHATSKGKIKVSHQGEFHGNQIAERPRYFRVPRAHA